MNRILTFALIDVLASTGNAPADGWPVILLGTMESVPPVTLVPRFVLGLRKLDARNVRGSEIDTAFGLTLASGRGAVASGSCSRVSGGVGG